MTHELPRYAIELTDKPDPCVREAIAHPLLAYNEALLGSPNIRPLAVILRSSGDGKTLGGLWGRASFKWLFIELLFVPDLLRGQHLGTKLLKMAEAEAKERGCLGAWLDTFSSGARHFYEKQDYRLFGEINDYSPGNRRSFLFKRFVG